MRTCDVLIIGAGLAGGCLARQLKLRHPELDIVVVDKKESFDYWVGESTIEVFEHYAYRDLQLGPYIEANSIQKNGLRFYWDSPEKNLSIEEMTEYGRTRYHQIQARQLDRARFDRDLVEMNRAIGVDVMLGTRVYGRDGEALERVIQIDRERGHTVQTSAGPIHCRWLVDAGGRSSLLARMFDLVSSEERASKGSYWCRYRNTVSIESLGDDAWRERIDWYPRWPSTNHYMYRGYWIWHIPVDADTHSIGVVCDNKRQPLSFKNAEALTAFLREHKCLDQILGPDAEAIDFFGLRHIERGARELFSSDRWFLTGMSGTFIEVLGSAGSRLLTEANRFIGELIRADMEGDDERYEILRKHFNLQVRARYQDQVQFYDDYDRIGSFEACMPWLGTNFRIYFSQTMVDQLTYSRYAIDQALEHGLDCGCTEEKVFFNDEIRMRLAVCRLTDEFVAFLDRHGLYHDANAGKFELADWWEVHPEVEGRYYKPRDRDWEMKISHDTYREVCRRFVTRMVEVGGGTFDEQRFASAFIESWDSGQSLADIVSRMAG